MTKAVSSTSFFFSRSSKFDRPNVVFSLSLRLILILVASRVPRWSVMIIVIVVRWPRLSDFRFEKKKKRKRIQKKGKFDLRKENSVRLCVLIFGSYGKVRIDRSVRVDFIFSFFSLRLEVDRRVIPVVVEVELAVEADRHAVETIENIRVDRRTNARSSQKNVFSTFFERSVFFLQTKSIERSSRRENDVHRSGSTRKQRTVSERTNDRGKTKKIVFVLQGSCASGRLKNQLAKEKDFSKIIVFLFLNELKGFRSFD